MLDHVHHWRRSLMRDGVFNLVFYVGAALFAALLLSLDGVSSMWVVSLPIIISSFLIFLAGGRHEQPALLVAIISTLGLIAALVITFLNYAFG